MSREQSTAPTPAPALSLEWCLDKISLPTWLHPNKPYHISCDLLTPCIAVGGFRSTVTRGSRLLYIHKIHKHPAEEKNTLSYYIRPQTTRSAELQPIFQPKQNIYSTATISSFSSISMPFFVMEGSAQCLFWLNILHIKIIFTLCSLITAFPCGLRKDKSFTYYNLRRSFP